MPTKSKWYRGEAVFIPVKDTIKHTGVIALGPDGLEYRRWIEDEAQGRKMLRSIRGIGIDTALMNDLEKRGVKREVIHFGGILYSAEWPTFRKYAIQRDYGYNPQHILPLGYWKAEPAERMEIDNGDFALGLAMGVLLSGLVLAIVKTLKMFGG